ATGQVQPLSQVTIVPEVAGRISSLPSSLKEGARFSKGDTLGQIDSRDYQARLDQAKAQLAAAELELALEQGRGETAVKQWDLIGGTGRQELAERKPHLVVAQANVRSAQAGVNLAKNNLNRTRLTAPFDAVVLSENLEQGQVVGAGTQAVTLAGTESFRVEVSVPLGKLQYLQVPGYNAKEGGRAVVRHGALGVEREGQIVGMAGQVDAQTRTATLLVDVPNPMDPPAGQPPMLIGSFVDVSLTGKPMEDVVVVPITSVREGREVLLLSSENTLHIEPVTLAWTTESQAFVRGDIQAGDRAITSTLSFALEGMSLQVQE
ncbi:MAG: RND family efflux transporter MFP subunit, partial [Cognaticolwellia sp.]